MKFSLTNNPKPQLTLIQFYALSFYTGQFHTSIFPELPPRDLGDLIASYLATPPPEYSSSTFFDPSLIERIPLPITIIPHIINHFLTLDIPPYSVLRAYWKHISPHLLNDRALSITFSRSFTEHHEEIGNACPKCKKHKALAPHPCPYKADVHEDNKTLCNCCQSCCSACADDI